MFAGQACGCTQWQAAWCPVHGDCKGCYNKNPYDRMTPLPGCPLHAERRGDKLLNPDLLPARLWRKFEELETLPGDAPGGLGWDGYR